jgi:serine-type D-Ala-D-Ala carboxypeptidase/endopeptidase
MEANMQLRFAFVVVAALLRLQESSVAVPAKVLEEYAGTYKLGQLMLVVTVEGDRLMAEAQGIPKFAMPARSQTKFFVPPASAEIEFVRGDDGAVTHLFLLQNGRQQRAQRLKEPKQIAVAENILQEYAGRYALPRSGFEFVITAEGGGRLMAESVGQFKYPLFADTETHFFFRHVAAEIEFRKDAQGRVTSLVLHRGAIEEIAERKGRLQ